MTQHIHFFDTLLEDCAALQDEATARWHQEAPKTPDTLDSLGTLDTPDPHFPGAPGQDVPATPELLRALALAEHLRNFKLWHVEDDARRRDVDDSVIADCKRRIDAFNQERNDRIERIDACLIGLLRPHLPAPLPGCCRNTETPGMAIDRLSILSLKIWHMEEETRRADASSEHIAACAAKLAVLREQRADLAAALRGLIGEFLAGSKEPKVYFQFKMYNDPNLNPQLYRAGR